MHVSGRQAQILALMARGLADKEIARRLSLSHGTVRTHIDRLFRDYGWHSRTEALAAWLEDRDRTLSHTPGSGDARWSVLTSDVPNFVDFRLSKTQS
jgi:DNA-binding CsgD family transcriptional regulator